MHIKANVLNKAAYLVSEGGAFNGCSITGIGFAKMEQLWYHAMEYHYTVNATFNDAYHAINQACAELETAGVMAPGDCQQVEKALQSVELDQAGTCSGIPGVPPGCALPGADCEDADLDGIPPVDFRDLKILTSGWLQAMPGDLDLSGRVDFWDVGIMGDHWLKDCGGATAAVAQATANISPLAVSPQENTLEVYVMSLCPYAKQAEIAILDHLAGAEGPPLLRIRYLFGKQRSDEGYRFTSLHGEAEIEENLVQMVLRNVYGEQVFFDYLRLRAYSDAPWDALVPELGLGPEDAEVISETIMMDREAMIAAEYEAMLREHGRLSRSPTWFWEGRRLRSLQEAPPFAGIKLAAAAGCR